MCGEIHDMPGQPQLDATLAGLLDGRAKSRGVAEGRHQAGVVIAQRTGDGLDTASVDIPWAPPAAAPGVWQPAPQAFGPAVRAGQGNARPFLLISGSQFRPGLPPALTSGTYLASLAEVNAIGGAASAVRTADQTSTALFWEPASNVIYGQLLRAAVAAGGLSFREQVALVAAFHVITTDAQIAIYDAKFTYVFWRPVSRGISPPGTTTSCSCGCTTSARATRHLLSSMAAPSSGSRPALPAKILSLDSTGAASSDGASAPSRCTSAAGWAAGRAPMGSSPKAESRAEGSKPGGGGRPGGAAALS
jgi:hypothetical protein